MRYNIPPSPSPPQEETIARSLLLHAERALLERIREHEARFDDFWNSSVPPQAIADKLKENGARFLFDASESLRHINVVACGLEYVNMTDEERSNKLHVYIPPEKYRPRLPLVVNPSTGYITVQSVDGLDDWGRPIPDEVPILEDE
jgi:hypothetical protein